MSYTPSNKSKDDDFRPFLGTVVKNAKKKSCVGSGPEPPQTVPPEGSDHAVRME